ncbi:hypothetical protein D9M71_493570 [compost metagenome]
MQHPPHIDMVFTFDVEHDLRIALQPPAAQSWQIELVSIAGGAGGWMPDDMGIVALQGIDETESDLFTRFAQVMPVLPRYPD